MAKEKITVQTLGQLSEEDQITHIKAWFLKYFHCPSESCFIDDDTGNWVFFSGPWDHAEVLERYFGAFVCEHILNNISEQLHDHASEWNSDYEPHVIDDFLLPIELSETN